MWPKPSPSASLPPATSSSSHGSNSRRQNRATCAAIILFKQIVCQVRDSKQDGSRMWAEKKYVNLPCQSSSSLFYFLLFFFILFGMQRYECFLEWQKIFLGVGKGGQLGAIGSTDSHMVISSWSIWRAPK